MNSTLGVAKNWSAMGALQQGVGIVELLVFLTGTPANAVVLYLAYRILNGRHNVQECHWFILTMAAWDIVFCSVHAPMMFAQLTLSRPFSMGLCMLTHFCTHASAIGSSLSLLLLNVDKFVHLYKPLHYGLLVTKKRAIIASALVCCIALAWAAFLVFGPYVDMLVFDGKCQAVVKVGTVYIFLAVQFFVVPSLASMLISMFTASVVLKARRGRLDVGKRRNSNRENVTAKISSGHNGYNEMARLKHGHGKHNDSEQEQAAQCRRSATKKDKEGFMGQFRLISFVFTTTFWSAITCLPYRIGFICILPNLSTVSMTIHAMLFVLLALMVTNSAGNPFITVVTQHQYTKGIKRLFRRFGVDASLNGETLPCAEGKSTSCTRSRVDDGARDYGIITHPMEIAKLSPSCAMRGEQLRLIKDGSICSGVAKVVDV